MASTSYGSSSTNNSFVFDIFINHRGPDCKKTLAKHLYDRLNKHGLRVFLDEDELQAGEDITPQIQSAIRTASVQIAIFSPGYADSPWCLNELLLMFESRSTIIPVFYRVEPADLRWEKGVYGQSLQMLEKKRTFDSQPRYDYNTIQKWRKALFDAAEKKGFDMKTYNGSVLQLCLQLSLGKKRTSQPRYAYSTIQKWRKALFVAAEIKGFDMKTYNGSVLQLCLQLSLGNKRYDCNTIQKWRKALTDAAEIKGFDMKTYNGDEQQLLEQVVEGVLKKVKRPIHVSRYPTGLDEKVAEFERAMLLDKQSSKEVRVIGIVGLGGAGKTTLAKEIFNRRRSNYKQTYFQSDVRENAARKSLKSLQKLILKGLAQVHVGIDSTDDGIEKLKSYLKSSQAFLILDDVDHLRQVEVLLLPVKDALQQGSLILVTSRNKDLLTSSGIAESSIFKLTGLDKYYSRELFCWHAFNQPYPPTEYEQVARAFVDSCAGLPLSLKVLGSLLRGKDLKYGKELLHDISKILPEDIMATLKISYDSLGKIEKQIFLDIVCFFIGQDKDTAIRIWDGTEWGGSLRFQNLENRCLVEVDDENRIRMHDHLRDLGRHIAETEPPEWTFRLSCPTHDLRLLSDKSLVRGISTFHSRGCERAQPLFTNLKEFAGSRFTNYLKGLQLIRTEGCFEESEFIESLPSPGAMSPIWLRWDDFPYSSLPSWISLKYLRVLTIKNDGVQKLWLHESQAPEQLRELYVQARDVEVPKSIGKLSHLEKIVVSVSHHLTLPDELWHLQSLKHLELLGPRGLSPHRCSACSSWNILPDSLGNLTNLQTIILHSSSNLRELPDSFGNLTNLGTIDLSWCFSLQGLPDSFGNLTNLGTIIMSGCCSLQVLPDSFGNLTNLGTIDMSWCSSLQVLPDSLGNLTNLRTIDLRECSSLQGLPDSLGNLTNLRTIDLRECSSLQGLPDSFGNLIQLECLQFDSLTVSYEVYEKMHTFKCSGVIDFNRVKVLPAPFLKNLPEDIMATLKSSYDSLDEIEKQIFLDIVCFFIGEDKDTAIRIWDGTEWAGSLRFQNLESRGLVEVDDENCIRMHDHLRDLGRHIAETEPPEWTLRLSCPTHELRLLSDKSLVRGISTVHSQGCQRAQPLFTDLKEFAGSSFTNYVRGLQLISTEGFFEESEFIESIFRGAMSLIWLCWVDFPYSSLPSWIPLKNLRVLRIERRWGRSQALWLHESQAPEQLRELYVLAKHVEVPKSIGKLRHLQKIEISFSEHVTLPDELCHLQSLKHFKLSGGSHSDFEFVGCSSLNMLSDSFGNLTNLQTIDLSGCSRLQVLPDSFGKLTNIQTIKLSECWSLRVLPDSFGELTNLQTIDLYSCSNLRVLPDSFGNLTNLQTINLSGCKRLRVLPDSFGNLTNLQTIDLSSCSKLQVLPDSFGNLIQLEGLQFDRLIVSPECFENMGTFKCSGVIDFKRVEVLPAPFLTLV